MKRILMALAMVGGLALSTAARADDACADKKKAVADATAAVKAVPKADLSSCKDKKGKEKKECEKPLKDKAAADLKDAKAKVTAAKKDATCCAKPKTKGCPPAEAAPATK